MYLQFVYEESDILLNDEALKEYGFNGKYIKEYGFILIDKEIKLDYYREKFQPRDRRKRSII